MGRKHGRVDKNQKELVGTIRAMGGTWLDLSSVGKGCPDGLIGYRGRTYLVEIKGPKGTLTEDQETFIALWRGSPVHVLRTVDGVIALMTKWKLDVPH